MSISIDAAALDAAIEGLDGITSAEVSASAPGNWGITIQASESSHLEVDDALVVGNGGELVPQPEPEPDPVPQPDPDPDPDPANDGVFTREYALIISGEGGTFNLRFNGDRTADLSISIDAAALDAAIEGLDGITSAEVSASAPGNWDITIQTSESSHLELDDFLVVGNGGELVPQPEAAPAPQPEPDPEPDPAPQPEPEMTTLERLIALANTPYNQEFSPPASAGSAPETPPAGNDNAPANVGALPADWLNLDEANTRALATAVGRELRSRHDEFNLDPYTDAELLALLDNLQERPGAFRPELPAALTSSTGDDNDGAFVKSYALTVTGESGTFNLRFDDDRTADLSISIDAAALGAAIEGLDGITSAEVSASALGNWDITIRASESSQLELDDFLVVGNGGELVPQSDPAPQPEREMTALEQLIALANTSHTLANAAHVSAGNAPVVAPADDGTFTKKYFLHITGDSGTFRVVFDDDSTADLPLLSINAAGLDAAIEGLDGITSAEVSDESGSGYNWGITILASEAHHILIADSGIVGNGAELSYIL